MTARMDVSFGDVSYFSSVLQHPENKSLALAKSKVG
jgi:hypothetical protein